MARHTRLQVTQGMSVPTKPITKYHEHFVDTAPTTPPPTPVDDSFTFSFSLSKMFTMTNILILLLLLVVAWLKYFR
jgi:hypothetical protein